MSLFYGRFEHVYSDDLVNLDDLMIFLEIEDGKDVAQELRDSFEELFRDKYGGYGVSYVLRDFGQVKAGEGYLVSKLQKTNEF